MPVLPDDIFFLKKKYIFKKGMCESSAYARLFAPFNVLQLLVGKNYKFYVLIKKQFKKEVWKHWHYLDLLENLRQQFYSKTHLKRKKHLMQIIQGQ